MKRWFKYFVLLSLSFLAVALWHAEYLRVPSVVSWWLVFASTGLLCAGYFLATFSWKKMLDAAGYEESVAGAVAGMGLSIFGKYIPGKVWAIAGRAGYTAQHAGHPLGSITVVSLQTQFVESWVGLTVGAIGLWLVRGLHLWGSLVAALWVLLTLLIFSPGLQGIAHRIARRFTSKPWNLPYLKFTQLITVLPWFALHWVAWGVGFYLLARGLLGPSAAWQTGFGFPLAVTLGLLAIIAPGGLGVREGVLTGFLILCGIGVADATTVAVASRLWFLIGEAFIFGLGLVANSRCVGPRNA